MILLKKLLIAILILISTVLVTTLILSITLPTILTVNEIEKEIIEVDKEETIELDEEINRLIIKNKDLISYYIKEVTADTKEDFEKEVSNELTKNKSLIEYLLKIELSDTIIKGLSKNLTDIYYQETPTKTTESINNNRYLNYISVATEVYEIITSKTTIIILLISLLIIIFIIYKLKKTVSETLSSINTILIFTAILLSAYISSTEMLYQAIPTSLRTNIIYDTNNLLAAVAIIIVITLFSIIAFNNYQKKQDRLSTYFK